MKFFLDTANLDEIKKAFELGILDGVTTNPALLSKQSGSYKEGVQSIVALTGVLQTKVNRKNEKSSAKFTRPKKGITKQAGEESHRQPG